MIFKNIFSFFGKKNQATKTPLNQMQWKDIVKECYDKDLDFIYPVAKVMYTDDKTQRAVILQRPDMTYTIMHQVLYPFDDDELEYITDGGLHGFWSPTQPSFCGIFDAIDTATNEIFSDPPFKYNKSIVWADIPFRIEAEKLYWISNDGNDDPKDFCLHGEVIVKIGEEVFSYDPTVSASALYLLRTLSDNHIINTKEPILPCCGHFMIPSDDLNSVNISGCNNGVDWSVIHENGNIKLITEAGNTTFIDIDIYKEEIYAFTDKIEDFFKKSSPKIFSETETFERDAYTAFWNEWHKLRSY